MKALYAPDTNFFLQFQQPSDVAWKDLTDADEIELVMLLTVVRELDKHGHGPGGRRRKVAERVLRSIRGLEPGKDLEVRRQGPRVVFREIEPADDTLDLPIWIDRSKPDEAILAEILEYQASGIAGLQLLTADMALHRLARRAGVQAVMPPDEWKLPPESDPNEKRVAELERQMRLVQGRAPEIRVWPEVEGTRVEVIEVRAPRFRPVGDDFVRRALSAVKQQHPDATQVRVGITVYTGESLETYKTQRGDWLEEIRERLERLHLILNVQRGLAKIDLCLKNAGAAIATGFVLEVDAEGPFRFVDPDSRVVERLMEPVALPGPPKLRSSFELGLYRPGLASLEHRLPEIPDFRLRATPDSPDFDWDYEEGVVDQVQATCGQFRRGRRPERHTLSVFVPADDEAPDPVQGRLGGWYTADNLAEEGTFGFPVRIHFDWQDTEAEAARLLREQLQVEL